MNSSFVAMVRAATTEQLKRFEEFAAKKMKSGHKAWGDIWLMVEGELVAREMGW